MGIRFYKPCTPGTRYRSVADFFEITRKKPTKALVSNVQRSFGRNNRGIITSQHRGKGHKRLYRQIDFHSRKRDVKARVASIEYDPNRNARICLLHYEDGEKRYILHPVGLNTGEEVISSISAPIKVGNSLPLINIPLGTEVHNIELEPGCGGRLARAAGSLAQIVAKDGNFVTLRLPSNEVRLISKECWATIGQVGNLDAINITIGKAGRNRWLGKRPTVRGSVKNPVDHPHGGGEGRAPIGRCHPVTPWGNPALGRKTRKKNRYSNELILRKRKMS